MTKTRSQTRTLSIKEEESKTEIKNTQLLNSINIITTKTRGKITKRRAPKKHDTIKKGKHSLILSIKKEEEEVKSGLHYSQLVNNITGTTKTKRNMPERESSESNNNVLSISQIKSDEESDTKSLLQNPQLRRGTLITQDQIERLVKYIVNAKMSIKSASRKVNININTAYRYYYMYKNDPEQKIPEPRKRSIINSKVITSEQIKILIHHIESDKLSVADASRKVKISYTTGHKYYKIYKNDPEQKIPDPRESNFRNNRSPTQEQLKALVHYIESGKMSVLEASRRTNISVITGHKYYNMYKNDPERKIPQPRRLGLKNNRPPTHNQVKQLINYIEKDNMPIREASIKVNISETTGRRYYHMYMEDPERKIPQPREKKAYTNTHKMCTQDQIKLLIDYIKKDGMSATAASKKVNMGSNTAARYYLKYLNDPNHNIPIPGKRGIHSGKRYTQNQIKELIGYIADDKMTLQAASIKANVALSTARKYYKEYWDDLEAQNSLNINKNLTKQSPQE